MYIHFASQRWRHPNLRKFRHSPRGSTRSRRRGRGRCGKRETQFCFSRAFFPFLTAEDYPSGFVVLGYVAHCHQQRNHRSRILRARKQVRRRSAHTIESAFRIDGSAGRSGTVQWVTRACTVNALDKGNENAKRTVYRTTDEWTPALIYLHFALEQALHGRNAMAGKKKKKRKKPR